MSSLAMAKTVVLDVVVADEYAIQSSTSEFRKRLFNDYLPDAEFRQVIVSAPQFLKQPAAEKNRVHAELKAQIAAALQPGDTLAYLILNTHGETRQSVTSLVELGKISQTGPDENLSDLFDSVKSFAAKNLVVIMNACSVFADNQAASSQRAQALLAYFGAPDGAVYGSKVTEVDLSMFQKKYSNWKSALPTKKILAFDLAAGLGAAECVTILFSLAIHNPHQALILAASTAFLMSSTIYMMQTLGFKYLDALKVINVGYLFRFRDGQVESVEVMQKMKDLAKSFVLPSKTKSTAAAVRCENIF
jgi:hypothetical protein